MTTQLASSPKLTAKQETFALLLFKGVKQCEAWGNAGYSIHMTRATIDECASRLAHSHKIITRLNELRATIASPAIATVTERLEILTKIANHAIEMPVSASHVIQAISEHNKMEHIYEPETRNVYQDIKVMIVREKPRQVVESTAPLLSASPEPAPEAIQDEANSPLDETAKRLTTP